MSVMTRSEFAKFMGVDKSQTTRWSQRGMPCNPDGSVDPKAAARWVQRHVDGTKRHYAQAAKARAKADVSAARRPPQPAPPAPAGVGHLVDNDIVGATMACVLPALAYRMPRLAAAAAVASGASREVGENVYRIAAVGVMQEVANLLDHLGVPAPTPEGWSAADMWDPSAFTQPDWEAAAKAATA